MKFHSIALATLFSAIPFFAPAHAATRSPTAASGPIDAWLEKAIEKDSSTAGMREATNQAREMWDKEMNASYKRLMSRLDASKQRALRESQRDWLKFRDSENSVIAHVVASKDGTMWQLVATSSGMDLVKRRALQLGEYEALLDD